MGYTSRRLPRFLAVAMISFLAVAIGCSNHPELKKLPTVPVRGKVTLNGRPITFGQGRITFLREDRRKLGVDNWSVHGSLRADGSYELFTHLGLNHGYSGLVAMKRGAPPGRYIATVKVTEPRDLNEPGRRGAAKSLIPKRYSSRISSGLLINVRENPNEGAYDLHLRS